MQIKDIQSEWEKDCPIDEARITQESSRIPRLHNKYLRLLYDEKTQYENVCIIYDEVVLFKTLYYTGKLDAEILKEKKLEPFHHRLLRQDVDMYLSADRELNDVRLRKTLQKEKIMFLEDVLKHINQRNFIIKTIVDWQRFTSGAS